MKLKSIFLGAVMSAAFSVYSFADEAMDSVRDGVLSIIPPNIQLGPIAETPIPGVFKISINNETYYAYRSGGYLLLGQAFDIERGVDLEREETDKAISAAVDSLSPDDMIVFTAANPKRYLTVFTDVDCGYCRRFHQTVPTLTAAGIEIRYLAFPRAGIDSDSYDTIVSVWCADDPLKAMTTAKSGELIESKTCVNPVAEQFEIGLKAGIQGTPTLVVDDGTVIGGFVPAESLLAQLGLATN